MVRRKKEKAYTGQLQCRHCLHQAPMEIVSRYSIVIDSIELHPGDYEDISTIYEILKCPACSKIMLQEYDWCDYWDGSDITPVSSRICNAQTEKEIGTRSKWYVRKQSSRRYGCPNSSV